MTAKVDNSFTFYFPNHHKLKKKKKERERVKVRKAMVRKDPKNRREV